MSTKVKGLLKGLRYISQIFEDEKEPEMQIGLPTDVKHVAHIGWDGPSIDSPSWMKDFSSQTGFQSAPLGPPGELGENPEIKWVSADSGRGNKSANSPRKDNPVLPKSSRRHFSADNSANNESPRKKDSSTKSRHSRRHHSKDSSDGGSIKSTRQLQESSQGSSSPSRDLPDIPKKSRRKKSKESVNAGESTKSRSKGSNSETGPDNGSTLLNTSSRPSPIPSTHEEEDESRLKSNGH